MSPNEVWCGMRFLLSRPLAHALAAIALVTGCSGDDGNADTSTSGPGTSSGSTSSTTTGSTGGTAGTGSTGGSTGDGTTTGAGTTGPSYDVSGFVTRSVGVVGDGAGTLRVMLLTKTCAPDLTPDDEAAAFEAPGTDVNAVDLMLPFSIQVPDGDYFLTAHFDDDGDGVVSSGDLVPSMCPPVQIAGIGVVGLPVELDTAIP